VSSGIYRFTQPHVRWLAGSDRLGGLPVECGYRGHRRSAFIAYINQFQIKPEERALLAKFGSKFTHTRPAFGGGLDAQSTTGLAYRIADRKGASHEPNREACHGSIHRRRHDAVLAREPLTSFEKASKAEAATPEGKAYLKEFFTNP
jgi:hypothetical protein